MRRLSRRTLLAGAGTAVTVALGGCLGDDETPDEEESPEPQETKKDTPGGGTTETSWPGSLQTALSFLYLSNDTASLHIINSQKEKQGFLDTDALHVAGGSTIDWVLRSQAVDPTGENVSYGDSRLILSGTVSVDEGEGVRIAGTNRGFDLYELTETDNDQLKHLASNGEVLLAGKKSWITETLDAYHDDDATYLEENDGAPDLLAEFSHTDYNVRLAHGQQFIDSEFDDKEFSTVPETLAFGSRRTEETLSLAIGASYSEPVGETEISEFSTLVESEFELSESDPETHGNGTVLTVTETRPYVPPEERPDVPSFPRYVGYDEEENAVLLKFENGEQLPAENFALQIADDPYTGDWARGQDTIGGGSVIAIDASAIEPGDSVTVSYESDEFSTAGSTSVLHRLPFRVQYDPDTGKATIEYVEGPPLDGSRTTVRVGNVETVSPWDSEVNAGDTAVLDDVDIDTRVEVRYEQSDGEPLNIGFGGVRPPGHFELTYDGQDRTLTVSYPVADPDERDGPRNHPIDQRPVPTAAYELRVDGEPAATQLTAAGDTVEPGDAVTVTDVPLGVSAELLWTGDGDQHYPMDRIDTTLPSVSFDFEYDDGTLTVTHAGGMDVAAEKLSVEVIGPEQQTVDWDGDGTVTEGDGMTLEDVEDVGVVLVRYMDDVIAEKHVEELTDSADSRGQPALTQFR